MNIRQGYLDQKGIRNLNIYYFNRKHLIIILYTQMVFTSTKSKLCM